MESKGTPCDVIVVGAGLVGALSAWRLAEEGQHVTVLEATKAVGGTSVQGAGVAFLGAPQPYATLAQDQGTERAAEVWDLTQENLALLHQLAQQLNIEIEQTGSLRLTDRSADAMIYKNSVTQLKSIGIKATLEDASEEGFLVGIRTQEDLTFNPHALIQALLDHPRIDIQTQTEVQQLKYRDETLVVWARKHYDHAKTVILAGGAYGLGLCPNIQTLVYPQVIQVIDLQSRPTTTTPLILNNGRVVAQSRGDIWRIVAWPEKSSQGWQMLTKAANTLCRDPEVHRRWSGWVAQTTDGLPIIGELPTLPGTYAITGLGPWGLSWAFVAVEQLVGLLQQATSSTALHINRLLT